MSVAHWTNIESQFSLDVALLEELLHDSIGPLAIQAEWFRRVAEIRTMDHVLKHLSTSSYFL